MVFSPHLKFLPPYVSSDAVFNLSRDQSLKNIIQYVQSKAREKNILHEDLAAREKRVADNPD